MNSQNSQQEEFNKTNKSKEKVSIGGINNGVSNSGREFGPPDLRETLNKNKKIVFIVGAVVLIVAGYFIFYKKQNVEPFTEKIIIGQIVSVDNKTKSILIKTNINESNYTVFVVLATIVDKEKIISNKSNIIRASFLDFAKDQNVRIAYEKSDVNGNNILAKKIDIVEFTPPPKGVVKPNYPKFSPPAVK